MRESFFRIPDRAVLPGKPGEFAINNPECCHPERSDPLSKIRKIGVMRDEEIPERPAPCRCCTQIFNDIMRGLDVKRYGNDRLFLMVIIAPGHAEHYVPVFCGGEFPPDPSIVFREPCMEIPAGKRLHDIVN
jgi:hypothetical protein